MTMGPAASIYCDNRAVILGCRRLQQFGWEANFWNKRADLDLWQEIFRLLSRVNTSYKFEWVKAHRDFGSVTGASDLWRVIHNKFADEAAAVDRTMMPADLSDKLAFLKAENIAFNQIKQAVHSYHRAVWDVFQV